MSDKKRYVPGITLRSLIAMVGGLIAGAIVLFWDSVFVGGGSFTGEHSIPYPAIIVLLLLTFAGAILWRAGKIRLLNRAELLCVVFAILIAMPMMTQGFWYRFYSITTTLVEEPSIFPYLGHFPEQLRPHGPNLLAGAFAEGKRPDVEARGSVSWESVETEPGRSAPAIVLQNDSPEGVSTFRLRVPISDDGRRRFLPGEPFLVTALARPGEAPDFQLNSKSHYYCRVYPDEGDKVAEVFAAGAPGRVDFAQKEGFRYLGSGAVNMPATAREAVTVEYGLVGKGRVVFARPMMQSNEAMLSVFKGKRLVTQSQFEQLPLSDRAGLVVKPDSMWSWEGVKFILAGHIPVRQWLAPAMWWTAIVGLLLIAAFSINVLLRKQWMDNERYQMPLTRVPMALLGYGTDDLDAGLPPAGPLPRIWTNRMMWFGLIAGLVWTLLRVWHGYNPKAPDVSFFFFLKPYFSDPRYGGMFDGVFFLVSGTLVSLAMFMELNILLSIVVGFFLAKSLKMVGVGTGWNTYAGYPYDDLRQVGAYLAYAAMILLFMRKHLWRVLTAAVTGDKAASAGEPMSYRWALLVLIGSFVGAFLWARAVDISPSGVLALFGFLVVVALIASKLRTECGAPFSYLGVNNIMLFMGLLGGMSAFGVDAVLFAMVFSFVAGSTPFFLIPGAQMELIELGRRLNVRPHHVTVTAIVGILGGMLIGGWVFLSASYGHGGRNMRNAWPYDKKAWYLSSVHGQVKAATNEYLGVGAAADDVSAESSRLLSPAQWAFAASAGATAVVALCRQLIPSFWFHPIGILLGDTALANMIWASCLVAYVLRLLVLHFGGARTVRTKLQPCFVGVFVGVMSGHLVSVLYAAWLQSQGVERTFGWWPFLIP